ncbi:unnamed protein product [Absidia cylindrospora]
MITSLFTYRVLFLVISFFVLASISTPLQQDNELTWIDDWVIKNAKFQAPTSSEFFLPGRYLIELAPASSSTASSFSSSSFSPLSYFQQVHEEAFENYRSSANGEDDDLSTTRMNISVQQTYSNPSIFLGASIDFHLDHYINANDDNSDDNEDDFHENIILSASPKVIATYQKVLDDFFSHQAIDKIYPVTIIPRPNPTSQWDFYRKSLVNITRQLPHDLGSLGFPFNLAQGQIDQTHNAGFLGQGMLVGIVDSGVDYYHPALGGGFGPEYTVTKGYDLVGNHFNVKNMSTREEHPTPLDNCAESGLGDSGHGTHVSGIIAADDKRYNFTGVAPRAKIGMWRVFSCNGSTSSDLVIKGLISAYEAGCDVINLSLGGPNNWQEDASAMIANRIANAGVAVSIAAGNDGSKGAFYISSPSTGYHAISVASINNNVTLQMTMEAIIDQSKNIFGYELSSSTNIFPNGTLVSYNNQNSDDELACDGSTHIGSLENQIVLARRGNCTYNEKSRVVAQAGGIGLLIYDPDHEMAYAPTTMADESPIPVAAISNEAGFFLMDALLKENNTAIRLVFNTDLAPQPVATGGLVSEFSSVGPTNEMGLKPNVAGIGGYVFSTLPVALGGYGILSGTSMASPFVAGCVALFIQSQLQDGSDHLSQTSTAKIDVQRVMENFANYAKPVNVDPYTFIDEEDSSNINEILDNPVKQGAGLIQVYDTIHHTIHVSPSQISFNDTMNRKPHNITITNLAHQTMTVQVIDQDPSVSVIPYNTSLQGYAPLEPAKSGLVKAKLSLTPRSQQNNDFLGKQTWTLSPGEAVSIEVRVSSIDYGESDGPDDPIGMFSASTNITDLPYPIFGGYLNIKASPTKTNENMEESVDDKSVVRVPYIGIQGNVKELPIFDTGFPKLAFKPLLRNSDSNKKSHMMGLNKMMDALAPIGNNNTAKTESLITSTALPAATNSMSVIVRLLTGTAVLVSEVWEYDTDQGVKTDLVGYASIHVYLSRNTLTDRPYTIFPWKRTVLVQPPPIPGQSLPYPAFSNQNNNRNITSSAATRTSSTVRRVPPGDYVLHWRALKLLADPSIPSSWEAVTSEPFEITS